MCIGCHGIKGYQASFPEVHKVPMISGQSAKYIVAALTAYKKGERKHPTMRAIAASLTEQDMADLAAYYEQQGKGERRGCADGRRRAARGGGRAARPRAPALRATAPTSASRSTAATPSSPASTPTTCTSRSRRTRSATTPRSGAATRS